MFESDEFKGARKYYRLLTKVFQNNYWILRWIITRHDTLADDSNINPESWNRPIQILRESYKIAFDVWCREYLYKEENVSKWRDGVGPYPGYADKDGFTEMMYNELSQKSMRFLIDFICTMYMEDTAYRELFNMWMFEMQFQMNKAYNPEQPNYHMMYASGVRNDAGYLQGVEQLGKAYTAKKEYHQKLKDIQHRNYARERLSTQIQVMEKQLDDARKALEKLEDVDDRHD